MDKKKLYIYLKGKLKARRKNVRYFNRAFFDGYIEWRMKQCIAKHCDEKDRKKADEECSILFQEMITVSDLYQKNSACYCEFLEVAAAEEKKIGRFIEANI